MEVKDVYILRKNAIIFHIIQAGGKIGTSYIENNKNKSKPFPKFTNWSLWTFEKFKNIWKTPKSTFRMPKVKRSRKPPPEGKFNWLMLSQKIFLISS